jgi:hypothetical protein
MSLAFYMDEHVKSDRPHIPPPPELVGQAWSMSIV